MRMKIKYRMRAPVSHIGETASTGSYFQTVLTAGGRVPVITGNSIRGQLRDSMAIHLLETMGDGDLFGVKVSKDVFNILFSGGNINGTMKDDVEKAKKIREHFPFISLMGGGLGDMIMSGKLVCSFAYPVCAETESITGIESDVSWHSLIDEMEFTRTDDGKNDQLAAYMQYLEEEKTAKASTQMRYSVQYMAAGTEFVQDFIFLDGVTDWELGAFFSGLRQWFKAPRLGGMSAKGFGLFDADLIGQELSVKNGAISIGAPGKLIEQYEDLIHAEKNEYLSLFDTKKEKKNGKKTDKPD